MAARCEPTHEPRTELLEFKIPPNANAAGRTIINLRLPKASIITLVGRDNEFFVPDASTILHGGDVVLALVYRSKVRRITAILTREACEPGRQARSSRPPGIGWPAAS